MTLIIRAPGRITSPLPGSFDPPLLGVSGIFSRYVSVGAAPIPGSVIAALKDQVGANDLVTSAGVVTFDELAGVPVISLSAAGVSNSLKSTAFSGLPKGRTVALLAYLTGNPAALEQIVRTVPTTKVAMTFNQNGQFSAYGDNTPYLSTPGVITRTGWHRIVVSFGADGAGKVAINGLITSGAFVYADSGVTSFLEIRAPGSMGMKFVDLAIIDHAVSDAEIASITAGLGEWLL